MDDHECSKEKMLKVLQPGSQQQRCVESQVHEGMLKNLKRGGFLPPPGVFQDKQWQLSLLDVTTLHSIPTNVILNDWQTLR